MVTNRARQRDLLAQCASEPIQFLGRTQRFGVLLAFNPRDRRVVACSANAAEWFGRPAGELPGLLADQLLPRQAVDAACAHARVARARDAVQHLFGVAWPGRAQAVDVTIHGSQGLVLIEAEPAGPAPEGANEAIATSTHELTGAHRMAELTESAVRAVARVTGYSRVMLYRFAADGSGTVAAEQIAGERPRYAGLRYPASDIPEQARKLYLRNPSRVIVDAQDEGLDLVGSLKQPLDLSLSVLRSVSPVHLQYLRNMGTAASMSISLVIDGRLWGLIACHHHEPLRPTLACRSLAELLGRLYSLAISRAERGGLDRDVKSLLLMTPGVEPLVDGAASTALFEHACGTVARLLDVSAVVSHVGSQARSWGQAPSEADAAALAAVAAAQQGGAGERLAVVVAESLAALDPALARLAPRVAGLLYLPLAPLGRDWVLLLRDEVSRHVTWAGDPSRTVSRQAGRLTPRNSFAAWSEHVRGHCEPWSRGEVELAEVMRVRLLEVMFAQRELRELESARLAARQQALLVRELNHRVRNMLGLIKGLVHQTASSAASVDDLAARLHDRVHALSRAYTQIERANWQPTALSVLVSEETQAFAEPGQVHLKGPPVSLEPNAFLSFALIVHELATNARKYGALSVPEGRLDIHWGIAAEGRLQVDWQERGGPTVARPRHRGFGTRVIGQALSHQLRGSASLEFLPQGLHACLSTPRGFVVDVAEAPVPAAAPRPGAVTATAAARAGAGGRHRDRAAGRDAAAPDRLRPGGADRQPR
jgi:light-regulated signal transduction histidine kinase (bacteriophytochrome)